MGWTRTGTEPLDAGRAMSAKTFADLVAALREVRAARMPDDPSNREIARALKVAPQTVGNWFAENNGTFPQSAEGIVKAIRLVAARAQACGIAAPDGLLDPDKWREAHRDEASRRAGVVSAAKIQEQAKRALAPGRALTGALGPFEYEVHRPVQAEDETGLPTLPPYVARAHDTKLAEVTRAAAGGRSGIAVMVGGSSTGKTRACWEAVQSLISPDAPWHLWHPIAPSRPEAALKDVPHVTPRTVVWLNDAQFYLDTPDSQGEKVAAALRELLRDDKRGPVLILATLWPEHWSTLTARPGPRDPDPHPQARELLSGRDIPVPEAFTPAELSGLAEASDPRLRRAAALSTDGEVTQFLAGAPELLSRYHNAGSSARALIDAAMDARRLGMGEAIPLSFLEQAAPAYLTDRQWNSLADDWLPESLTYTGKLCKGVLGPLTKIRERPGHSSASREDTYRLADYLDQHARRTRRLIFPPSGFWTAAGKLAIPETCNPSARQLLTGACSARRPACTSGPPHTEKPGPRRTASG